MTAESEARFTGSNTFCPSPEWWHSTDEDSTEIEVSEMLAGIVRGLQPEFCVETGTAHGQTTQMIGEALRQNGHGGILGIEPDPMRAQECRDRCAGLPVDIRECESLDYTPHGTIDFAFFDSLFGLRVAEFKAYRPHMHTGTFVAFHDTAPEHGKGAFAPDQDLRAYMEAELSGEIRMLHCTTPRGVTLGIVT